MKRNLLTLLAIMATLCICSQERMRIIQNSGTIYEYEIESVKKVDFYNPGNYFNPKGKVADAIDLGLSVKWASWNMGASTPMEYGGYYGWGDPSGEKVSFTGYPEEETLISATAYDIATAKWGGGWRLPTKEEMQELIDRCTWEYTVENEIPLAKVTGPNGESIILPLGGERLTGTFPLMKGIGYYWTGEKAYLEISSSSPNLWEYATLSFGLSVRPVYGELVPPKQFHVETPALSLAAQAGATATLQISSNISWAIQNVPEWLQVSPQTGNGNATITITALTENELLTERIGQLKINNLLTGSETIEITQAASTGKLKVTGSPLILESSEDSRDTINIVGNIGWTIENHTEWLSVPVKSSQGNAEIIVSALSANPNIGGRAGNFTIFGANGAAYDVYVMQMGAGMKFEIANPSVALSSELGAKATFTIQSNIDFSITGIPDWLSLSKVKGSGNETITVTTLSENPALDIRTATLFVNNWVTGVTAVTVTQAGANMKFSVGATRIELASKVQSAGEFQINGNVEWTIEGVPDWLSLSKTSGNGDAKITVKALSENNMPGERTAKLIIKNPLNGSQELVVTQAGIGAQISVSGSPVNIEKKKGAKGTFEIKGNIDFTISDVPNWIKLSSTSGTGNAVITVTANSENTTIVERKATINVNSQKGTIPVEVVQEKGDMAFSISSDNISLGTASGENSKFQIKSNVEWEIKGVPNWLAVKPLSGNGDAEVTVATLSENTSLTAREATLKVNNLMTGTTEVNVTQAGATPTFSIKNSQIKMDDKEGATAMLEISGNVEWTIEGLPSWLKASQTKGTGSAKVTLTTLSANNTGTDKKAEFKVSNSATGSIVVTVTQTSLTLTFKLSATSLTLSDSGNGAGEFTITTNTDFAISGVPDWLELSQTEGKTTAVIKVKALSENPTTTARTATLTITSLAVGEKTIKVTQPGAKAFLSVEEETITLGTLPGGSHSIAVSTNEALTITNVPDWIRVTQTELGHAGVPQNTIMVTVTTLTENTAAENREGSFTISNAGGSKVIKVIQEAAAKRFVVTGSPVELSNKKSASGKFQINSNIWWRIQDSSIPDWLSLSTTGANTDAIVEVVATSENTSANKRTATLKIMSSLGIESVEVTQKGAGISFSVDGTPVKLSAEKGAEAEFTINTNADFTITNVPGWLEVTPTTGNTTTKVKVKTLSFNNSSSERSATIYIRNTLIGSNIVNIVQAPGLPELTSGQMRINNTVTLSDAVAFDMEFASDVESYYCGIFDGDYAKTLSDTQITNIIKAKTKRLVSIDLLYMDGLDPNNDIMICCMGVKKNGSFGKLEKKAATTKTNIKQPSVDISITLDRSGYNYKLKKNQYCSMYYTFREYGANIQSATLKNILLAYYTTIFVNNNSVYQWPVDWTFTGTADNGETQLFVEAWGMDEKGELSGIYNTAFKDIENNSRTNARILDNGKDKHEYGMNKEQFMEIMKNIEIIKVNNQ